MSETQYSSHSTQVEMWLDCGKHGRVEISRITPTMVIAKEPKTIPPGYSELIVTIDGQPKQLTINLTHGFSNRNAAKFVIVDLPF